MTHLQKNITSMWPSKDTINCQLMKVSLVDIPAQPRENCLKTLRIQLILVNKRSVF